MSNDIPAGGRNFANLFSQCKRPGVRRRGRIVVYLPEDERSKQARAPQVAYQAHYLYSTVEREITVTLHCKQFRCMYSQERFSPASLLSRVHRFRKTVFACISPVLNKNENEGHTTSIINWIFPKQNNNVLSGLWYSVEKYSTLDAAIHLSAKGKTYLQME